MVPKLWLGRSSFEALAGEGKRCREFVFCRETRQLDVEDGIHDAAAVGPDIVAHYRGLEVERDFILAGISAMSCEVALLFLRGC